MIRTVLSTFPEWKDMSVFVEMKPRSDVASLFIDVPPNFREKSEPVEGEEKKKIKYEDIDIVHVTNKSIRIGQPPTVEAMAKRIQEERLANGTQSKPMPIKKGRERSASGSSSCSPKSAPSTPTKKNKKKGNKNQPEVKYTRFGATIDGATIHQKTLVSPTWAENSSRLFVAKVHVEPDGLPLVQKTAHRLAKEVCKIEKLEEFAKKGLPKLKCSRCRLSFLSDEYIMTIGCLPDDDWLSTAQSADYYCRDSCGAACDPAKHGHVNQKKESDGKAASEWLPHEKKVMISYANSVLHESSVLTENVIVENKIIKCAGCKCQLGRIEKNHPDLYSFNHIAATITSGPKNVPFIANDLMSLSSFLSQLVLNCCETQTQKLVIRSLDKVPYLLVWLLDSYVVIANGEMEGLKTEDDNGQVLKPFPAIKLLYKVFNHSTAVSDPRANGEDTSVGLVDLPLPCCETLIEFLLRSSHCLPPACRAVGQFFVGFIQIDDCIL